MRTIKYRVFGFTLIELLVVVSLIGVLATLVLANLNAARQRGRDAQRKSDLRNIQTALRLYYNDVGVYPVSNSSNEIVGCNTQTTSCTSLNVSSCGWDGPWSCGGQTYMSTLPGDPLSPERDYIYIQTDADTYTLSACLENRSDEKCSGNDTRCTSNEGCIYTVSP